MVVTIKSMKAEPVASAPLITVSQKSKVTKSWKFIIDSREKKQIRALCKLYNIPFEQKALPYGDFALQIIEPSEVDPTIPSMTYIAGVERKRADDFISSVHQQRIFKQVNGLSEMYKIPILAISGSRQDAIETLKAGALQRGIKIEINEKALNGTLASIFVRRSPHILWFEDDETMITVMYSVFEKIYEEKWQLPFSEKPKRDNTAIDALTLIPGITKSKGLLLLNKYGSISNIIKSPDKELQVYLGHIVTQNLRSFFFGSI